VIFSSIPLQNISGISGRRLTVLAAAGITTPEDLLRLRPNRYLDRSTVCFPSEAREQDIATFVGTVVRVDELRSGKRTRLDCTISDGRSQLHGVWFQGHNWVKKAIQPGQHIAFFGQVRRFGKSLSIAHPDFDILEGIDDLSSFSRIVPIYPSNKPFQDAGISSGLLSRWIKSVLDHTIIHDPVPAPILASHGLAGLGDAVRALHFPDTIKNAERARLRLAFDELFLFQCALMQIRGIQRARIQGYVFTNSSPLTSRFFNTQLPFALTEGQKSALSEIKADVRSGFQMNRLVQGDVGAGKTIVALGAILLALDNGYQAAFMAPTELLAEQHFRTLQKLLAGMDVNVRLLTGNQSASVRMDILTSVESGTCQILIGTHALIEDTVRFRNLGLAVVDEQHRFGVAQRMALGSKGGQPHVLVMSATPIPRSLAMTVYGNLDVSIVKGLPSGRKPVATMLLRETDRTVLLQQLKEKLNAGQQAFVVFPLIEDSEVLDLKSATYGAEQYSQQLPGFRVALLHGRLKKDERETIMTAFQQREIDVLVSTTVIEVGIDIPNASTIIIEHAERFGLAQLHQLRGRVGRGNLSSACYLMAGKAVSADGWHRLRTMERTNDGFEIAETDLSIRGPGDFLGTKQSGLPEFVFADIVKDQLLLMEAKAAAERIFKDDPLLSAPEHDVLRKELAFTLKKRADLMQA
jgi:ATP-dependent DNA helicase RecG